MASHATVVKRFFEAQFNLFDIYNDICEVCKSDIADAEDQDSYELTKKILGDLIQFEIDFSQFDHDLWNYIYDIDNTRAHINELVSIQGLADHKEYFFRQIEKCVNSLNDVATEIKAAGFEWDDVDKLLYLVEGLYDASEDLIEIDPSELYDPEIVDAIGSIPPQRVAPIEVASTQSQIIQRPRRPFIERLSEKHLQQARSALDGIFSDMLLEIEKTNCDERLKRSLQRCAQELTKPWEEFSPLSLGINISISLSFSRSVVEEFTEGTSSYVLSSILECEKFVRNFSVWREYEKNARNTPVGDTGKLIDIFSNIISSPLFDEIIRDVSHSLSADKKALGVGPEKFEYSILQSVSNLISHVFREVLKYLAELGKSTSQAASKHAGKLLGGALAGWVIANYQSLVEIAESYSFLSWAKPLLELIKKHVS